MAAFLSLRWPLFAHEIKNASALFYDNSRALARNQAVIKRKFFRKLIVIIMLNILIKYDFIYHYSAHNCLS